MNKLIIILLVLQPLINKITLKSGVAFDVYNELISLLMLLMFCLQTIKKGKINSISLLFFILIAYMLFVVTIKQLYPLGYFQVIIYSQWFFYFLYFFGLSDERKTKITIDLRSILDKVILLILFLSFIEIPFYEQYRAFLGVQNLERGIGGFYMISFFGSGPSLANFISFYVIVWYYYHYGLGFLIRQKDKFFLFLAFTFLILSFSRKEVLFVFLFLLFFPFDYRSKLTKWVKKATVFIGIFTGLLIYYLVFFSKANDVALGEKYIRWRIAEKSQEILFDNLPWGSGPGTFGSRVSLMMTDVYEKYNVGPEMLGYEVLNQTRGPIYDAFLFTFTAEVGIGIFIFLFFYFKLFEANVVNRNKFAYYVKNFIIVYFFGLSIFQPVLISSFGYLVAILLGLLIGQISLSKFKRKYAKV